MLLCYYGYKPFSTTWAVSCWRAWSSFDHSGSVNGKGGCLFTVTDLSLQVLGQQSAQTDPSLSFVFLPACITQSTRDSLSGVQIGEDTSCLFEAANIINTINMQFMVEAHSDWESTRLGIEPLTWSQLVEHCTTTWAKAAFCMSNAPQDQRFSRSVDVVGGCWMDKPS